MPGEVFTTDPKTWTKRDLCKTDDGVFYDDLVEFEVDFKSGLISYNWRFAPGSSATILYRNQISSNDDQSLISYTESLDNLFGKDIGHQFSIRINYFLDYNRFRKKRI